MVPDCRFEGNLQTQVHPAILANLVQKNYVSFLMPDWVFFLDVVQFRTKDNGMCEWPGTKGGWEMAFPLTVGLPTCRVL